MESSRRSIVSLRNNTAGRFYPFRGNNITQRLVTRYPVLVEARKVPIDAVLVIT